MTTTEINTSFTSVQAIAEVIHARLEPEQQDLDGYEFEDIVEDCKNAYAGVLWKTYLQMMDQDGDRTVIDPLLQHKRYDVPAGANSVELTGVTVINAPRDAGVYQVIPIDKDGNVVDKPLTKTNASAAFAPKSRIPAGYRYYRVGETLYFPDGLPPCTVAVEVVFMGLLDDQEIQQIPRDMADQVREKVWAMLYPSKNIRADITNNKNVNE